ncbi:hypothetical protein EDC56_0555 [Sinobacterium caligoides]|uniref:Uncharacterized protein n=1 Tax=Sinobacterium caligoides TaxID=933926 RepID=A0A3N2DYW3_9GAMM|nr:hypothetical protein [Sinobacterium caligoides]ROS05033.1 hypothetical protein EDC56_0555 [Sinobacterium caligoides]
MTQRSFNILFRGQTLPDFDVDVVKNELTKLLKLDEKRITILFSGRLITIKKNLSEIDAQRYIDIFADLGAKALLNEVVEEEVPTTNKAVEAEAAIKFKNETSKSDAAPIEDSRTEALKDKNPKAEDGLVVARFLTEKLVAEESAVESDSITEVVPSSAKVERVDIAEVTSAEKIECPRCNHLQAHGIMSCEHCNMDLRRHLLRLEKRQRLRANLTVN